MKGLKIKPEFLDTQIGFNGSGLPLGIRKDLHVIAKTAIESGDKSLLNLFEEVPTLDQIKEYEGQQFLAENPDPVPASVPVIETPKAADDKAEKNK